VTGGGGGGASSLTAGEAHVGQIGGTTALITVVPALSLTAYSSGDNIGGKLTLSNAVRIAAGTGLLQSIQVLDRIGQNPALEIILFDSDPSASTFTDNAAFAVTSPDALKELGRVSVSSSDWVTVGTRGRATLRGVGLVIACASGRDLFAALAVNGSTPTYTAVDNLQLRFGFLLD
jgi:hypothetical protein